MCFHDFEPSLTILSLPISLLLTFYERSMVLLDFCWLLLIDQPRLFKTKNLYIKLTSVSSFLLLLSEEILGSISGSPLIHLSVELLRNLWVYACAVIFICLNLIILRTSFPNFFWLKGLELNRHDAWATHAVAHCMEMNGRAQEGIKFMESTEKDWSVSLAISR